MCYAKTCAGYENLSHDFNVFLVGDATLGHLSCARDAPKWPPAPILRLPRSTNSLPRFPGSSMKPESNENVGRQLVAMKRAKARPVPLTNGPLPRERESHRQPAVLGGALPSQEADSVAPSSLGRGPG